MKNQKGITLIALVITIIVLLILAAVSIAMLTGPNGLLTQASNADTQTAQGEAVDRINLALDTIYAELMSDKDATEDDVPEVTADSIKADFDIVGLPTHAYDGSGSVATTTVTITSHNYSTIVGKIEGQSDGTFNITKAVLPK